MGTDITIEVLYGEFANLFGELQNVNYLKDCMPEATKDIVEREVPGIPEAMRAYSMTITPRAMLSRAAAGIRKGTLIVNLPGSPKAVRESLEYIIPALEHGLQILTGEAANCARK